MCVSRTTKSTGFVAAHGFISAAHGPPHLRSDSAFSVHSMGTRSLATKRRASEAIKVSVSLIGSRLQSGECFFLPSLRSSFLRLELFFLKKKKKKTQHRLSPSTPRRRRRSSSPPSRSPPRPERSPSLSVSIACFEEEEKRD